MKHGGVLFVVDLLKSGGQHLFYGVSKSGIAHLQLHNDAALARISGAKQDVVAAQAGFAVTAYFVIGQIDQHAEKESLVYLFHIAARRVIIGQRVYHKFVECSFEQADVAFEQCL